jgi:hypothetical protein
MGRVVRRLTSERSRGARITRRITDPTGTSFAARAREARFELLLSQFPTLGRMRVLDLGGAVHSWAESTPRPAEVVLLNVPRVAHEQQQLIEREALGDWIRAVHGDACDPPDELTRERFDLVFSNSVIEHLGGHERRLAFARATRTLGDHHWVQTPNRYFPIEPHWLFPGFQFLPVRLRAAATSRWPIGNFTMFHDAALDKRMEVVLAIELLSQAELRFYFPGSKILRERVGPLTKSLVAVG